MKAMALLKALRTLRPESLHSVAGNRAGQDPVQRPSLGPELCVDRKRCTSAAGSRTGSGSKGTTGHSCRNEWTGTSGQGA